MSTIAEHAADVLITEEIWTLHDEARVAWGDLAECDLAPPDALLALDCLHAVHDRLEALRPAILENATRQPERHALLKRLAARPIGEQSEEDD